MSLPQVMEIYLRLINGIGSKDELSLDESEPELYAMSHEHLTIQHEHVANRTLAQEGFEKQNHL